jgi:hypothetical protein
MRTFLFQIIIAKRPDSGLYQAGVHGHALIDGKPLDLELAQDLGVLPDYKFTLFIGMVV